MADHRGDEASVMDLDAGYFKIRNQATPLYKSGEIIWEQAEVFFDQFDLAFRAFDRKPKAATGGGRTCADVPKFRQYLRRKTQSFAICVQFS